MKVVVICTVPEVGVGVELGPLGGSTEQPSFEGTQSPSGSSAVPVLVAADDTEVDPPISVVVAGPGAVGVSSTSVVVAVAETEYSPPLSSSEGRDVGSSVHSVS